MCVGLIVWLLYVERATQLPLACETFAKTTAKHVLAVC